MAGIINHARLNKQPSRTQIADYTGKDPDVKAWAGKTLPTLEEHLKLAQDANKAVGTSGTKEKK